MGSEIPRLVNPTAAVLATSIYYFGKHYEKNNAFYRNSELKANQKFEIIRNRLCEHLGYAISLYEFVKAFQIKYLGKEFLVKDLDPTPWQMRDRQVGGRENSFVVTPSTNPMAQYSSNSVDLRLGPSFLINKTIGYTHISPDGRSEIPLEAFYEEVFIPTGKEFVLHPHQFVLTSTLEYISIPFDFYALVLGRSSWGRLGLNIATATTVHAGFRGCITLELRNLGETPLPLNVGIRIAQLCLIPVPIASSHAGYFAKPSKYIGPISPEIPKLQGDPDWDLLRALD